MAGAGFAECALLLRRRKLAKAKAYQVDLYGRNFFPGLGAAQQGVFKESLIGSAIKHFAGCMMITSTMAEKRELQRRKDDLP